MQALFRRLTLSNFEIGLIIIAVGFEGVIGIHQVHVGFGEVALECHERTMVRGDLHQDGGLLSWGNNDFWE